MENRLRLHGRIRRWIGAGKRTDAAMDDSNKAMQSGDWTAYGEAQTRLNNALQRAVDAQKKLGG